MKLLTKAIEKELSKDTSEEENPTVVCHWFNPYGRGHWFGISKVEGFDDIIFGYVSLFGDWNDELGDFSLSELESLNVNPFNRNGAHMGIERDLHWTPKPLNEVKQEYTR